MSILGGPDIVTDGLVLYLDASNRRSYLGSGTAWSDMSGNGNTGTLTNGPTFDSGNGGSISFDGSNDEITFPGSTFGYSPGTLGEVSLETWVYPTGPFTTYVSEPPITNLAGLIGQGYYGASTGWGIGIFGSTAYTPTTQFAFQVRNSSTISSPTAGFEVNNWYHVVGTFTRNDFTRIYVNGMLISSASSTSLNGLTLTPSTNNASVGRINTFYSGCRVAIGKIYNRPLLINEVLQNYNATRSRFGV